MQEMKQKIKESIGKNYTQDHVVCNTLSAVLNQIEDISIDEEVIIEKEDFDPQPIYLDQDNGFNFEEDTLSEAGQWVDVSEDDCYEEYVEIADAVQF